MEGEVPDRCWPEFAGGAGRPFLTFAQVGRHCSMVLRRAQGLRSSHREALRNMATAVAFGEATKVPRSRLPGNAGLVRFHAVALGAA